VLSPSKKATKVLVRVHSELAKVGAPYWRMHEKLARTGGGQERPRKGRAKGKPQLGRATQNWRKKERKQ
jgi:hypothetical protein